MSDVDDLPEGPGAHRPAGGSVGNWARGGLRQPGSLGSEEPVPTDTLRRTIVAVTRDWEPPNPRATPRIEVTGRTLEAALARLNSNGRWGIGGGSARNDDVPRGSNPNVTVAMHANLVLRMPTWTGYDRASAAAKAEWDRMLAAPRRHEQRHVDISVEELNRLATELIGADLTELVARVTQANREMQRRQDELDHDTDHGARAGVPFGDVWLDTTIP
jgi:hypothetical protein